MSEAEAKVRFVEFVNDCGFCNPNQFPEEMEALDALIKAVRADERLECFYEMERAFGRAINDGSGLLCVAQVLEKWRLNG